MLPALDPSHSQRGGGGVAGRGRAGAACRGARDGRSACSFLVPYINGARDGMDLSDAAAGTPGAGTASRGPSRRTSAPSRAACASRCPTAQISLDTLSLSRYPIFVWIPYLCLDTLSLSGYPIFIFHGPACASRCRPRQDGMPTTTKRYRRDKRRILTAAACVSRRRGLPDGWEARGASRGVD